MVVKEYDNCSENLYVYSNFKESRYVSMHGLVPRSIVLKKNKIQIQIYAYSIIFSLTKLRSYLTYTN